MIKNEVIGRIHLFSLEILTNQSYSKRLYTKENNKVFSRKHL